MGPHTQVIQLSGQVSLFNSVSDLYTLGQAADDSISAYMIRACRLFSGLHGVTFNTMANLFIIVNSDRSGFCNLSDRFYAGDPDVVNVGMERLETLLETI